MFLVSAALTWCRYVVLPEQTVGNNIILCSWFGGKSLHCVCLLLGKRVQLAKLDILTAGFQEERSDKVSIASHHRVQPN